MAAAMRASSASFARRLSRISFPAAVVGTLGAAAAAASSSFLAPADFFFFFFFLSYREKGEMHTGRGEDKKRGEGRCRVSLCVMSMPMSRV
jgi:hypothetical protein